MEFSWLQCVIKLFLAEGKNNHTRQISSCISNILRSALFQLYVMKQKARSLCSYSGCYKQEKGLLKWLPYLGVWTPPSFTDFETTHTGNYHWRGINIGGLRVFLNVWTYSQTEYHLPIYFLFSELNLPGFNMTVIKDNNVQPYLYIQSI